MLTNKFIREYMIALFLLLPYHGKKEFVFLKTHKKSLCELCNTEKISSIKHLNQLYGSPAETVSNYLQLLPADYIIKKTSISYFFKRIFAVFFILFIICSFTFFYYESAINQSLLNMTILGEQTTYTDFLGIKHDNRYMINHISDNEKKAILKGEPK